MVGRVIRKIGSLYYNHPMVPEDAELAGPFARLKVALVADHFTTDCLSVECRIKNLTPSNYREVLDSWRPDLVFVESAFHGAQGSWRYELAKQPRWLRLTPPQDIFRLVEHARSRGIPTVFWNKDDGAFFDAFIDVAKVFDFVFTTDEACLKRYRGELPPAVPVNVLMMPYQPHFHTFDGFHFRHHAACFMGSYYRRILNERRRFLDMVFGATDQAGMKLHVFDRNHGRLSSFMEFRFPRHGHLKLHPRVAHRDTAHVYKSHVISLNVNSVTGSSTMISRRLLEILACGGIAVTNGSPAVDAYFKDFCHVIETCEQAIELFARMTHGPSTEDLQRAEAGARYVERQHSWAHRLEELCAVVGV
ncbi:MAG: Spore protein YkvP [Candidatus Accumulibacter adjunctus]|uniref:Spore protein YkvP n=1 Tax=Candidatus Accumulibacter adjunctus TaxID=1454001 RepID=A0A011NVE2_9PROT|nr:MAG: Spore protein YkvP [Candidatus Accumulibacter adjunctus]